jgi:hypothetical protein
MTAPRTEHAEALLLATDIVDRNVSPSAEDTARIRAALDSSTTPEGVRAALVGLCQQMDRQSRTRGADMHARALEQGMQERARQIAARRERWRELPNEVRAAYKTGVPEFVAFARLCRQDLAESEPPANFEPIDSY